jgi:hypothetical protein
VTTRAIRTPFDIDGLAALLQKRRLPVTITITDGLPRTKDQNKLQRLWCNEAAEQLGDQTGEDVRGYAKLHFGVPILRMDDDVFCEEYDRIIRPLPYEHKLALMKVPFDFGVTRRMTTKQLTRYLDTFAAFYAGQGVVLTIPDPEMKQRRRSAGMDE